MMTTGKGIEMKKIENLLSEKPKLTEEDIRYLLDALHAYKRSEIDYLLFIQDILTEEKYYEYRRKIEDRHQEVLEKLLSIRSYLSEHL